MDLVENLVSACSCNEQTRRVCIFESEYPCSLNYLHSLLYSDASPESAFITDFFKEMGYINLTATKWSKNDELNGEIQIGSERQVEYIVPVSIPMGPKMTRCIMQESVSGIGINNRFICIHQTTTTPDVPSGNAFKNHIRICMSKIDPKHCKIRVLFEIEFTKTSWIRMAIERAAPDGYKLYYKKLDAYLKNYLFLNPQLDFNTDAKSNFPLSPPTRHRRSSFPLPSNQHLNVGGSIHSSRKTSFGNLNPKEETRSPSRRSSIAIRPITKSSSYASMLIMIFLTILLIFQLYNIHNVLEKLEKMIVAIEAQQRLVLFHIEGWRGQN